MDFQEFYQGWQIGTEFEYLDEQGTWVPVSVKHIGALVDVRGAQTQVQLLFNYSNRGTLTDSFDNLADRLRTKQA